MLNKILEIFKSYVVEVEELDFQEVEDVEYLQEYLSNIEEYIGYDILEIPSDFQEVTDVTSRQIKKMIKAYQQQILTEQIKNGTLVEVTEKNYKPIEIEQTTVGKRTTCKTFIMDWNMFVKRECVKVDGKYYTDKYNQ